MGYKAIKEFYQIEHIIQVREGNFLIGSPFVSDIIVFNKEGKFLKKYKNGKYDDGWSTNEKLKRYQEEMLADIDKLKQLINQKDEFKTLLPIYTEKDGLVVSTYCEEYGWPNVTIEGQLMYENTFFESYDEAKKYAKKGAVFGVKDSWRYLMRTFSENWERISKAFKRLTKELTYYLRTFLN